PGTRSTTHSTRSRGQFLRLTRKSQPEFGSSEKRSLCQSVELISQKRLLRINPDYKVGLKRHHLLKIGLVPTVNPRLVLHVLRVRTELGNGNDLWPCADAIENLSHAGAERNDALRSRLDIRFLRLSLPDTTGKQIQSAYKHNENRRL